jgi:hypothetical protein
VGGGAGAALGVGKTFLKAGDTVSALLGGVLEPIDGRVAHLLGRTLGEVEVEAVDDAADEVVEIGVGLGVGGVGGIVQPLKVHFVLVQVGLGLVEIAAEFVESDGIGVGGHGIVQGDALGADFVALSAA